MSLTSYRAAPPRAKTIIRTIVRQQIFGFPTMPAGGLLLPRSKMTLSVDLILKKEPPGNGQAQHIRQQRDKVYPFTSYRFRRPGSDLLSRALRQSTIGAAEFHGRVRNGIGWGICAITTWSSELANIHIKGRHPNFEVFKT